jgi:hypothetical protein
VKRVYVSQTHDVAHVFSYYSSTFDVLTLTCEGEDDYSVTVAATFKSHADAKAFVKATDDVYPEVLGIRPPASYVQVTFDWLHALHSLYGEGLPIS